LTAIQYRIDIEATKELAMQVNIKKWGNSASVRIPVGIMEAARLQLDDMVDVSEQDGRIVITPIRSKDYDLNQLLAAITPENLHGESDFGLPVGQELL
jgi:antitoxin MazE